MDTDDKRFLEAREILDTEERQARCFHSHSHEEEDERGYRFWVCDDCGAESPAKV